MRQGRTVLIRKSGEDSESSETVKLVIGFVLLMLSLGLGYAVFSVEVDWRETTRAYSAVRGDIISGGHQPTEGDLTPGDFVHFTADSNLVAGGAMDTDFDIELPFAWRAKRVTEYCQWIETHSDREDDNGDTIRTYYYHKGWHSRVFPSILYDQPAHHHNPLRDPLPSTIVEGPGGKAGEIYIDDSLTSQLDSGWEVWYYSEGEVRNFWDSGAFERDDFKPMGNGYFYSEFKESHASYAARIAGMYLEGSLDIQWTELWESCTPGDIRIHFEYIAPRSLSFIGKYSQKPQRSGQVLPTIGTWEEVYNVGVIMLGVWHNPQAMIDTRLYNQHMKVHLFRVLGGSFIAILLTLAMGQKLGFLRVVFRGLVSWWIIWATVNGVGAIAQSVSLSPIASALFIAAFMFTFLRGEVGGSASKEDVHKKK
eukprot:TRINITY_DN12594_c0_g1_i1.p1 TRINITY_DN12594_c0_g1~~TRINITY_DN12594_c0_g1_i1.p1  ORF type:complete len:423 (+),score=73.05 TRINITY_DN12594_c0_g1_i1:91-1359(+)